MNEIKRNVEILTKHVRLLDIEYKLLTIMNYVYFLCRKVYKLVNLSKIRKTRFGMN